MRLQHYISLNSYESSTDADYVLHTHSQGLQSWVDRHRFENEITIPDVPPPCAIGGNSCPSVVVFWGVASSCIVTGIVIFIGKDLAVQSSVPAIGLSRCPDPTDDYVYLSAK